MYEIVIDRVESIDPSENQSGASFIFNTMAEVTDFIELCFKANKEIILMRKIEDK